VRLTGKGKTAFRNIAATHENWIDELLKELTARGAVDLSAKLKPFRSNWEG
jgi:hypothetical protein